MCVCGIRDTSRQGRQAAEDRQSQAKSSQQLSPQVMTSLTPSVVPLVPVDAPQQQRRIVVQQLTP
jgi:hypothetical protein